MPCYFGENYLQQVLTALFTMLACWSPALDQHEHFFMLASRDPVEWHL